MAQNRHHRPDELEQWVRDCRGMTSTDESLSPDGRDRILGSALAQTGSPAGFPSLFMPVRRWTWAVIAPTLTLVVLLGSLFVPRDHADQATLLLSIDKEGDQIVFNIANGGQPHSVYRSSSPEELANLTGLKPFAEARGSFQETVQQRAGDGKLIFYRID